MINDLDSTVETLLRRELPALVGQVAISFAAPDDNFPPSSVTLPAIDLFLYDVRENRELRNNEWIIERQNGNSARRHSPPVRVDCSYLITAWPSDASPNPSKDEHMLLGEVMMVLLRYPLIPAEVLQGSLEGQELPLPAGTLLPGRLQSLGEFWQALGGKPKAALNYTVTIAVDQFQPEDLGRSVDKIIVTAQLKPEPDN
jgi:hypothetical protein